MKTYREYSPTQFDPKGLGLNDQQNWLVCPVIQTRDSDVLERSNFDATLRELGGESDTVEVHRFGHWGPGWFEIIIINPADEAKVKIAQEIEDALSDYPIVDEELHSEYEHEECAELWEDTFDASERLEYFRNHSYTASNMRELFSAIKSGSWYDAGNLLHCPSDILY